MSGLEAPLLLGVDSLPKKYLTRASNSEWGKKQKKQLSIVFERKVEEKPFLKLKMFSNS